MGGAGAGGHDGANIQAILDRQEARHQEELQEALRAAALEKSRALESEKAHHGTRAAAHEDRRAAELRHAVAHAVAEKQQELERAFKATIDAAVRDKKETLEEQFHLALKQKVTPRANRCLAVCEDCPPSGFCGL
jgi:hypothetical protein